MRILFTKLLSGFVLFLLLGNSVFADDSKLVGHWKSDKLDLNLKADHTYVYKVNVFNFNGKWSATNEILTLNYSILGVKKNKTAGYHFDGNNLVMVQAGKSKVSLKKQ